MHTESEAEKLWCPFVRVPSYAGPGEARPVPANRMTRVDDECNCIASSCAAWRWLDSYTELSSAPLKPSEDWQNRRNEIGQLRGWERVRPNRRGYCGLAGKPD